MVPGLDHWCLCALCWTSSPQTFPVSAKWAPGTMQRIDFDANGFLAVSSLCSFAAEVDVQYNFGGWSSPPVATQTSEEEGTISNFLLHWKKKRELTFSTQWAKPSKMEFCVTMTSQCPQWLLIMHMCAWQICCWSTLDASGVCLHIATPWLKPRDFRWYSKELGLAAWHINAKTGWKAEEEGHGWVYRKSWRSLFMFLSRWKCWVKGSISQMQTPACLWSLGIATGASFKR